MKSLTVRQSRLARLDYPIDWSSWLAQHDDDIIVAASTVSAENATVGSGPYAPVTSTTVDTIWIDVAPSTSGKGEVIRKITTQGGRMELITITIDWID